jgi:hydrogenase nickel incorporation protein HypA/HybF
MHEIALAEGVISTVLEVAKREKFKKINKIKIKIGELQQIDDSTFSFLLKEIVQKDFVSLKNTIIDIDREKAKLKCLSCGNEWEFEESKKKIKEDESEAIHFIPELVHAYVKCPQCGSCDFEISKGDRIWIESIEGEI